MHFINLGQIVFLKINQNEKQPCLIFSVTYIAGKKKLKTIVDKKKKAHSN